jgi:hypothetical protein
LERNSLADYLANVRQTLKPSSPAIIRHIAKHTDSILLFADEELGASESDFGAVG